MGVSSTSLTSKLNAEICMNLKAKTLLPHVVGSVDSDLKKKKKNFQMLPVFTSVYMEYEDHEFMETRRRCGRLTRF